MSKDLIINTSRLLKEIEKEPDPVKATVIVIREIMPNISQIEAAKIANSLIKEVIVKTLIVGGLPAKIIATVDGSNKLLTYSVEKMYKNLPNS